MLCIASHDPPKFPTRIRRQPIKILQQQLVMKTSRRLAGHAASPRAEEDVLRGVKNHLFFPEVYLSSKAFLTVFFASSRCDTSLNVSAVTAPFRPSSSSVYRVGIRWL